ncbi:MAG: hypothetical protein ACRC5T_14045, partial [Cetobacterium sp.]
VLANKVEMIEIPPIKWKHFFSGMPTGRVEQKAFSIKKATGIMGRKISTDDEADAICVLHACLNMEKEI